MKFRGRIAEGVCIRKFYQLIATISKIGKTCVLRLTPDKVFFIICDRAATAGGPTVWAELDQINFFHEYCLEGVSPEQNEIYLEFTPDKLFKTLNSLKSNVAQSLKIKLTKKNAVPCLTFEVELASEQDCKICIHDIPVQVIARRMWADYSEPDLPPVHVSLCLPDLKKLKHLTERFKSLGSTVAVTARKEGTLVLKVDTEDVTVSTYYRDLRAPLFREGAAWQLSQESDVSSASVRVDLKRLSQFLHGEQLHPEKCLVNIIEHEVLHMVLLHQDFILQFYLPKTSKS